MFAFIFASPDWGAAGAAAFVGLLFTALVAVMGTVLVLVCVCRLKKRQDGGCQSISAVLVAAGIAAVVTVLAGLANGLRDDFAYFLQALVIGTSIAIVVGCVLLLASSWAGEPPADHPPGWAPEQIDISPAKDGIKEGPPPVFGNRDSNGSIRSNQENGAIKKGEPPY
jgi:hypothetical protein